MKQLAELLELTANKRASLLKSAATSACNAKVMIAKLLVAARMKGDFDDGEMNAYAQRVTGIELRRELQGTYEAVNVLQAILDGECGLTEAEFESCPDFGRVTISGLLSKAPEKVAEAVEIIRSGTDVTKRLKELKGGKKKPKAEETPEPEKESTTPPPVGRTETEIEIAEESAFDLIRLAKDECALSSNEIVGRILADIEGFESPEACDVYSTALSKLLEKVAAKRASLTEGQQKAA